MVNDRSEEGAFFVVTFDQYHTSTGFFSQSDCNDKSWKSTTAADIDPPHAVRFENQTLQTVQNVPSPEII